MARLEPLSMEARATLLVIALEPRALRRLVGRLGTAPQGERLDKMSTWDMAWSLVDFYGEAEVAEAVDRTLEKALGQPPPLAPALASDAAAAAVSALVLEAQDPLLDLAWALLARDGAGDNPLAVRVMDAILAELDAADAEAEATESAQAASAAGAADADAGAAAPARSDAADKTLVRDAQRARTERDRARSRLDTLKARLAELEGAVRETRRELKAAAEARATAEIEGERHAHEVLDLRARLASGTAAEVERRGEDLAQARRRIAALEAELDEARSSAAALTTRVRELEARPRIAAEPSPEEPVAEPATWSMPVFSAEFYESLRGWDRKIVRLAFEKVARLAEDWRHPSLRAIPLEGLPDGYRIRVATDVRLIYRPLDGGRVEILSLIDREDLTRYIRQAKTR